MKTIGTGLLGLLFLASLATPVRAEGVDGSLPCDSLIGLYDAFAVSIAASSAVAGAAGAADIGLAGGIGVSALGGYFAGGIINNMDERCGGSKLRIVLIDGMEKVAQVSESVKKSLFEDRRSSSARDSFVPLIGSARY